MVPVRERLLFLFSSDLRTERERGGRRVEERREGTTENGFSQD